MRSKRAVMLLVCASLTAAASAQTKTITVRPQHSKKVIYTLKPGESVYGPETMVYFNLKGIRYEFVTQINNNIYLHANGTQHGPFKSFPYKRDDNSYHMYQDGKTILYNPETNSKTGPFDKVVTYSYGHYYSNLVKDGYAYEKNKSWYLQLNGKGVRGPFRNLNPYVITGSRIIYSYMTADSSWYLHSSGKKEGPYKAIYLNYVDEKNISYTYDKNGQWFTFLNGKTFGPFASKPEYRGGYGQALCLYVKEPYEDYPAYYLLEDGTRVGAGNNMHTYHNFFVMSDGTWVKIEKTDVIKYEKEKKSKPHNEWMYPVYIITKDGKQGPFTNKQNAISNGKGYVMHIQDPPLYEIDEKEKHGYKTNTNVQSYIVFNGKKIGPLSSVADYSVQMGKTSWCYLAESDRKLFIDGEYTGINRVSEMRFLPNSDDWKATAVRNDTTFLYSNGKLVWKMHKATVKRFEKRGNGWYIMYFKDNADYIQLTGTKEPYGPFNNVRWRTNMIFSKDENHFACFGEQNKIIIDGKIYDAVGFALNYDEARNAFVWISQEGRDLVLNTFELDK